MQINEKKRVESIQIDRRTKMKLAFDELEREVEVLSPLEMENYKGGWSGGFFANDCTIHALAFATGKSYSAIETAFGQWSVGQSGYTNDPNSNIGRLQASGMDSEIFVSFAMSQGLLSYGDTPQGPNGMSVSGDHSIAMLNYGGGSGHVVVLTGNANFGEYHYYDPQNNSYGTISKNDGRIAGTIGYY